MSGDEYVQSIINKYAVQRGRTSPAEITFTRVAGPLEAWAGQQLNTLSYSGSYAKETGVRGTSDIDVFISFKSNTTNPLEDLYEGVVTVAAAQGWSPRRQNVSVGVTVGGVQADLVPAKVQAGTQNYHSLFRRKTRSWVQTNVSLHIDTVKNSGRTREIRAIKVWRKLHRLDFPSLYLELFTIKALSGRSTVALASNVLHVLQTLSSSLANTRIIDPANTNNVISEDLTATEKQLVSVQASRSAAEATWEKIIW